MEVRDSEIDYGCQLVEIYEIMDEAHRSKYTMNPGSTKMFKDLQRNLWWKGMKKDIAEEL